MTNNTIRTDKSGINATPFGKHKDNNLSHMSRIATVVVVVLWTVLVVAIPGRFVHGDDSYYKDPGRTLREKGVFSVPSLKGQFSLKIGLDKLFATYPPVYPFGYYLWLGVFPDSYRSSLAFDGLVSVLLTCLVLYGFPRIFPNASNSTLVPAGLAVGVLGTYERPDQLAMLFGYLGYTLWRSDHHQGFRSALGGIFAGFCVCTSFAVTLVLSIWWAVVLVYEAIFVGLQSRLRSILLAVVFAVIVSLSILVPYYARPGAWSQFREVSALLAGCPSGFYLWFMREGYAAYMYRLPLAILLAVLGLLTLFKTTSGYVRANLIGILISTIVLLLVFPIETNYFWFATPALLILVFSHVGLRSVSGLILAATIALASNDNLREALKSGMAEHDAIQGHRQAIMALRQYVGPDTRVVTDEETCYDIHESGNSLLLLNASLDPTNEGMSDADAFVFRQHFSRLKEFGNGFYLPDSWVNDKRLQWFTQNFEVVFNNLPTNAPYFLGIPIGRTPVGYGPIIYKRKHSQN